MLIRMKFILTVKVWRGFYFMVDNTESSLSNRILRLLRYAIDQPDCQLPLNINN